MSADRGPERAVEAGDTTAASNAEVVVPGPGGAGASGSAGGPAEGDPAVMERAIRQADDIEGHNEPAGDDQGMRADVPTTSSGPFASSIPARDDAEATPAPDVPPPDVGEPDPNSPAGMPPTPPTPDDPAASA